jgi:hypothetical protein
LQRNSAAFNQTLAAALGIAPAVAERITRDHSGEPIVVAAKALDIPAAVLQRILLFLNPVVGQSVARVYELSRLYDEITLAAAQRMLAIWRQGGAQRRPAHAPVYYDDERRRARSAATPGDHRAPRERNPLPSRQSSKR